MMFGADRRSDMDLSPSRIRLDEVLPEVYGDLKAIASRALTQERVDHSYQTTELVHEVYLRLASIKEIDWSDPDQLLRAAVGVVRRVLIDYARARKTQKRNPGPFRVVSAANNFNDCVANVPEFDLLELEEALEKLKMFDERKAELVQLRYFGGQDIDTIARLLSVSATTIKREWALAKAWLQRELS